MISKHKHGKCIAHYNITIMFKKSIDSKSTFFCDGVEMVDLTEPIFKMSDLMYNGILSYYKVSKDMEMRPDKIGYAAYGDISYTEIILKESGIDNPFAIEVNDNLYIPSLNTVYTNVKDLDEFDENTDYVRAASKKDRPYDLIANYHKYIDKNKLPKGNGSDVASVEIPSTSTSIDPNLLSSTYTGVTSSGKNIMTNTGVGGNIGSAIGSPSVAGFDSQGNPIYAATPVEGEGGAFNTNNIGKGGDSSSYRSSNSPIEANLANKGQSGIRVSNGKIYFGNGVIANSSDVTDVTGSNEAENELVDCAKNGVTLGQFLNATIKNSIK